MPGRDIRFQNHYLYHIFNKSVEGKHIFNEHRYAKIFLNSAQHYRSLEAQIRYSDFRRLRKDIKDEWREKVSKMDTFKVSIIAYCLMPTHFHFLIEQNQDGAIQKYIADVINSFTRYYNIACKRVGPLFLPRFKAASVTQDNQLIHVSRYIHLNPYSSKIISDKYALTSFQYSSYPHYVTQVDDPLVQNKRVMELFNYDKKRYQKFVLENAQYQQTLEAVKHTYKW